MKNLKTITLLLCSVITLQVNAQKQTFELKPGKLFWTGSAAFSAYDLTGSILLEKGELEIRNDSITKLNVMVNMKSLEHENSTLKKHLRSKDFFEVNTFKKALFQLRQPAVIRNNTATITGDLKVKDVIKPQTFTISLEADFTMLSLDLKINRTDYGITYNSPTYFEKLKNDAIADEFILKGKITLQ